MAAVMNEATRAPQRRGERGQAIILFVGILTVIFVIAAIVVDFGLWFAERRDAQRAADLAATAGAPDLPLDESEAFTSACEWASQNGFDPGEVTVDLLTHETLVSQWSGSCSEGGPSASFTCSPLCGSLRVTIRRPAHRLFTSILGVGSIDIGAVASAGVPTGGGGGGGEPSDDTAADTIVLLSAWSGMRPSTTCPFPCPILEALSGARELVDILLGDGNSISRVGYVPYNFCYEPPWEGRRCIPEGIVVPPTGEEQEVLTAIDDTPDTKLELMATTTNECLPLFRALQMVEGRTGGPRPSIIFLSGGHNNYRHSYSFEQYNNQLHFLPPECTPAPAPDAELDKVVGVPECDPLVNSYRLEAQEHEQDRNTWEVAQQLKEYADIYVIAFNVCGPDDGQDGSDPNYCAHIGDAAGDRIADQRLLKCIATSPDHYFPIASAAQIPEVFEKIAWEIAPRGLIE